MTINNILLIIIIVGLANMSFSGLFNFNLITMISSIFGGLHDKIEKLLYIIIIISSIIFFMNRDLYESYLGETWMPKPIEDFTPNGNLITIIVKDLPVNTKVLYWATIPKLDIKEVAENEIIAYDTYVNRGITTTNKFGAAVCKLVSPIAYKDGSGNIIKPHINYRYWDKDKNMFSRLYKQYL
jgi:uncharacterized membrane protein YuzA (DUF378 family)